MVRLALPHIHMEQEGAGQSVVLLHGWGQNMYMMKFLQDHLKERCRVLNMDLPGFGESGEPSFAWSPQEYADALHMLLEELHMERPILIAHSFGARIALCYGSKYPCDRLILTGAAGILPKRGIGYHLRVKTYKLMKRLHLSLPMGSEDYQRASEVMKGVLVKSVNEDLRALLPSIPCETLLVWGEKDEQTPLWMGKLMEKELPNAALVVLKGEGHFAYFHQSTRFLRIVDAFLEGSV